MAALAVFGGCEHHHGIGMLSSDAGVAFSGWDASGFSIDTGAGAQASPVDGSDARIPLPVDAGGGMVTNLCGNGVLTPDETCDDGNRADGDGCSADCKTIEPGWQCRVPGMPCAQTCGVSQIDCVDADGGVPGNAADIGGIGWPIPVPTSWIGYIESQFETDAIRFTLTLSDDSPNQIRGTVFLNDDTPLPPATDPNVGYPPDVVLPASNYWAGGFAYSMVNGTYSLQRFRFAIRNFELWSGWCALQTPSDSSGMCLPNWTVSAVGFGPIAKCFQSNPATGQETSFDCGKYDLCVSNRVCLCSTTACAFDPNGGRMASFDLAISGNSGDGSVTGFIGQPASVHVVADPF